VKNCSAKKKFDVNVLLLARRGHRRHHRKQDKEDDLENGALDKAMGYGSFGRVSWSTEGRGWKGALQRPIAGLASGRVDGEDRMARFLRSCRRCRRCRSRCSRG
jgi:hypothetical protein